MPVHHSCLCTHFVFPESYLRTDSTVPSPSYRPSFLPQVMHEATQMMYVFGGYDGGRSLNDLFRLDLASSEWAQVRP